MIIIHVLLLILFISAIYSVFKNVDGNFEAQQHCHLLKTLSKGGYEQCVQCPHKV